MPDEILAALAPTPGKTLVDGTLGAGGHSRLLADVSAKPDNCCRWIATPQHSMPRKEPGRHAN